MKTKIAGIYLISSLINNKYYIGSSINIKRRWTEHNRYLKQNKHHSKHLQNHYNKHGKDVLVYSVLEEVKQPTKELLLKREQYWMDLLRPEFNNVLSAGSILGYKLDRAKYYYFEEGKGYSVIYTINGIPTNFNVFQTEQEAIAQVKYIKTLTEQQLIMYLKECRKKPYKRTNKAKHYSYSSNKYSVEINFKGQRFYGGRFTTEQEAINKVIEFKLELGIE